MAACWPKILSKTPVFMRPARDPDISVVVVTYNRAAMLHRTLETLARQATNGNFSFEILVIDDGSTDDTAAVVAKFAEKARPRPVRYFYKNNGGEGEARNRGVAEARGSWIAFCDDDQLADPGWLAELYKVAQEKRVYCVGGAVALLLPEAWRRKLGPLTRQFFGEKWLSPHISPHAARNQLGAGNVLVHRSVFESAGGFDPTFHQGVDTDFFWRVAAAGFSFGAAPKALVHHVIPNSRLQPAYLRNLATRMGIATHRIQLKYEGRAKVILALLRRLGIALAVDLPLLLLGTLCRDDSLALAMRCRLWFKDGFVRSVFFSLAPGLFPQHKLLRQWDPGYRPAEKGVF